MSSIKERFSYKNQESLYNNNIGSLYPSRAISKKANIFELMEEVKLEKKNKKKSSLKYCSIFAGAAASLVLFYSLY